jgi:hypothetical protein
MKAIITTLLLLLMVSAGIQAQTATDRSAVLKQIIEHPELQKYYAADRDGNLIQPYVIQYPVRFTDEVVNTLGSANIGILEEDALPSDAKNWLRFRSMGISANIASGIANLFYTNKDHGGSEVLMIHFELNKTGSEWQITNLNVGGR